MEAKTIRRLLAGKELLKDENSEAYLVQEITAIYIKFGLHRKVDANKFQEEVNICAGLLIGDISNDPKYRHLRTREIGYCFNEGLKGRIGENDLSIISYKTLIRWIESYVNHDERKIALRAYQEDQDKKPELKPHDCKKVEDDLMFNVIGASVKSYMDYCDRQINKKSGSLSRIGAGQLPLDCIDYANVMIDFLRGKGYATHDEKFIDVLKRARTNNGKLLKVC